MTEAMKHRLVGAAVLIALGVIVWPVIFDSSPVREISQRSQIPEEPANDRFTVDEPARPQFPPEPERTSVSGPEKPAGTGRGGSPVAGSATAAAGAPSSATPALRSRPGEPPAVAGVDVDASGLPRQWAVQLGVFSQLANARELQQRANAAGFHAIVQSSGTAGAEQHRVYVNPKLDRGSADGVAAEVKRKLGVNGFVTRYYP